MLIILIYLLISQYVICNKDSKQDSNNESNSEVELPHLVKGNEILLSHNVYRMKHGSEPLEWSDDLSKEAYDIQKQSQNCEIPNNYPSGTSFLFSNKKLSPQNVIDIWYMGIIDYDFYTCGLRRRNKNTLNFTQIIWNDSKKIGCSVSRCNKSELWICKYSPEGNIQGEFCRNVKPINKDFDEIKSLNKIPFDFSTSNNKSDNNSDYKDDYL